MTLLCLLYYAVQVHIMYSIIIDISEFENRRKTSQTAINRIYNHWFRATRSRFYWNNTSGNNGNKFTTISGRIPTYMVPYSLYSVKFACGASTVRMNIILYIYMPTFNYAKVDETWIFLLSWWTCLRYVNTCNDMHKRWYRHYHFLSVFTRSSFRLNYG